MNVTCKELRARAWNDLKHGGYWYSFMASFLGGALACLIPFITTGPCEVGMAKFYVDQAKDKRADLNSILYGFTNGLGKNIITSILVYLFLSLWSLLLIVPGIIKSFSYALYSYLLIDADEDVTPTQIIDQSRALMNGYKWKLFKLQLSFIGWFILGGLLCGVGTLFVLPYYQAAMAEFYLEVRLCNENAKVECEVKDAE